QPAVHPVKPAQLARLPCSQSGMRPIVRAISVGGGRYPRGVREGSRDVVVDLGDVPVQGTYDAAALPGVVDEGLARRLKALACTGPLHDLDARKSRVDWADASVYQMAEIGFQAIDQVTIAMDFDGGASHDQVISRLVPFIAAQAPGRERDE